LSWARSRWAFGLPDKLDQNFLWHWLKNNAALLKSKGKGATFLQVTKEDISSLEIILPPLEEQRRIASILDKAMLFAKNVSKRLQKLDELLQATFIDIFGDPVRIQKLKLHKLSEIGTISQGILHQEQMKITMVVLLSGLNLTI
jgi:type I restriction enzyme S subunit